LARLAIILREGSLGPREVRLSRILDFFGVPWKEAVASDLPEIERSSVECVVFGPICRVAAAVEGRLPTNGAASKVLSFYAYVGDDPIASERGIRLLCGRAGLSLEKPHARDLPFVVSKHFADLAGPMSGLSVLTELGKEDAVLTGAISDEGSRIATIISAGGLPVFIRYQHGDILTFFTTSSQMVDINQPTNGSFYDVKEHFCSIVPLVMFLRFMFPDVVWRPQEHGACLIIDDPLLKPQYGFCDFAKLGDLMRRYRFTTNIAFIPWNWRRTSPTSAHFFKKQPGLFSLSVHGCDHIGGEFGAVSLKVLNNNARLAQARMRNHEGRTGMEYDPVMVFPQGVFCSKCPDILKRNGFLAAVNTETAPVDSSNAQTQIKDVWDLAIMRYDGFPIFTRRYTSHGVENFAFDLLLGKPCLIVAHHDAFKDGGTELINFIKKLSALDCSLRWRQLGEVVRRACRWRTTGVGAEEVEMYGTELRIDNPSDESVYVKIRKRESHASLVSEILCDEKPVLWTSDVHHIIFADRILPRSEKHFKIIYRSQTENGIINRSLRYEISVMVRRVLSELRDDYLSKSRFLSAAAGGIKGAFIRNN
jgi:hypothetical protein